MSETDTAPSSERALAPDLARGVMLLFIALAHAPAYLFGRSIGVGGFPAEGGTPDRVAAFLLTDLVNGRAYPMFAALLGYGVHQLVARRAAASTIDGMPAYDVRRRGWFLLLFGAVHAALLWSGDILGAYGVVLVCCAGLFLRLRGRAVAALGAASVLISSVGGATGALPIEGATSPVRSTAEPDLVVAAGMRVLDWLPTLVLQPLGVAGAVAIGVWAARRRVLEEPERHGRLLRRTALGGLVLACLGGLPMAWLAAGSAPGTDAEPLLMLAGGLHYASGYGGIGYAALVGLAVVRLRRRGGADVGAAPVVRALGACGQRSLSCYLAQSVVFVTLLAASVGGLGAHLGLAAVCGVAVLTWLATVLAADQLRRRGRRGPAEILLRRLTYGREAVSAGRR